MSFSASDITNRKIPVGILIANIGSPQAPNSTALRKYLSEFLSDRRIIDWPRFLWLPILYGIVLTFRPSRSARLYKNIWENGSPLLNILLEQQNQLSSYLGDYTHQKFKVVHAVRYGIPSVPDQLERLKEWGARRILIFPLFPQHSSTTTASTYDAVFDEIKTWSWMPEIRLISDYHDDPGYIATLASSITEFWNVHGKAKKLLFSFHGIPQRYAKKEDPYRQQCQHTAELVAERLGLADSEWQVSFQSRFGPEAWMQPYTDETLKKWGEGKLESVHVICPGFSADCLETLDEINREGREIFTEAGGGNFNYIPALNDRPDHIEALGNIVLQQVQSWLNESGAGKKQDDHEESGNL